jgi:osmotically-inducible protein OsmY
VSYDRAVRENIQSMRCTRRTVIAGVGMGVALRARPVRAQIGTILTAPVTLINRALEDRSAVDIAKDNEIVIKVNAVMAEVGTIKASTEIYEQRLLVTGLFDDRATYDKFERGVRGVAGVKRLYWHVVYMSDADQKADKNLVSWARALEINSKAEAALAVAKDVHHLNYRLATDAFATLYVLGRALSAPERNLTLAHLRSISGVRRVVDYIEVRPKAK